MITYYLATNEVDVFHYGEMEDDMEVVTGQPKLTFYNTKEELISVLVSYGHEYKEPTYSDVEALQLPEPTLPEE